MTTYASRALNAPVLYSPQINNQNLRYAKQQIIKVYDASGNFIDIIRDAPYVSIKDNINAASDSMTIVLPRAIDAYDGLYQPGSKNTIVLGNNVQVWVYGEGLPSTGLLKYNGIIDRVTPKIDESGSESVEVLITPYSQLTLGDHAVTSTLTFGTAGSSSTYIDTGAIFQSFFTGSYINSSGSTISTTDAITGRPYGDPYTLDPMSIAATGQKTQFAFQNQNMLSTLTNVLLLGPNNYYYRMNHDKTTLFSKIPATANHTLKLGQHITSIEYPQDNVPRKNVIVIQGKGVTGTYIGSSANPANSNYVGQRVYFKADNRITDAATAQTLANGIGAIYDQTVIRAKVKIPDYRGDQLPGLGYDIEQFKIGQTVKIIDARASSSSISGAGSVWGSFVWGRDKWGSPGALNTIWGGFTWGNAVWGANVGSIFNTVVPIMSIQYDFFSCILELGFRQPTLNRAIYELAARFADSSLVS